MGLFIHKFGPPWIMNADQGYQFTSFAWPDRLRRTNLPPDLGHHASLRRFTRFSESADPEEVMQILEAFHAETSKLTAECGGTIIQRAGDGVMIVLNDPITIDEPATRAVELAAKLRVVLASLCENWQKYEYDLSFGIGLSYGYATLGVVGSEKHQNYTAIGPAINIASRLCDGASDGQVLVTQRVCTEVGDAFTFEPVGELELKGVSRAMNVFSLK